MGVSHIALAVRDIRATHRFYTEAMGFELVKTEIVPKEGGFARHVFYSTGPDDDQLMAFWDLSNDPSADGFSTDICRDLGLDVLTNHLAFTADDLDDLAAKRQRWLDLGLTVLEIDHGWIVSIYTEDPDGIAVEFATLTTPFTAVDADEALVLLEHQDPPMSTDEPSIQFHVPESA
jgi:catechol 2,3-dioxygenase-like lactoylglutathione lyase family enzyme